jgi:cobalt-zinc-cadmium efflux system outer membrane protein
MQGFARRLCLGLVVGLSVTPGAFAQSAFTWQQIRDKFEATNPTLQADQTGVDESKASEVTAFLRPNPQLSVTLDQIGNNDGPNIFSNAVPYAVVSYLRERQHKRELRRDSAKQGTDIAVSGHVSLDRTLVFALRSAFVQVLASKASLALARDDLTFYDQVLTISRGRLRSGDIAQIDLDRLELQRVQLESAAETADVNVRTAKIQLLALLNDRTPIDQFDVVGTFDFTETIPALADVRRQALDARTDLRAALQGVDQAKTNYRLAVANGTSDPTFSVDFGAPGVSQAWKSYSSPMGEYAGISVSLPLRIFDKNQGEKARTQLDIKRNEQLADVARAQVFSDVDSAHVSLVSTVNLLRPYKDHYLMQATRVRDIVTMSYQRGGAALLDFLQAEQDYRAVQLSYIGLVGSYLTVAGQLNMAVGQDVIP